MTAIALNGVRKAFGATSVLGGVDLDIRSGEFLTLVGPSGCGKSTLLRILAGLEAPDAGAVSIGGRDVTGMRAADRDLAMVFQSYALYPHLSVAENMATPLTLRELSALERAPLVGPLLSRAKRRAIAGRVCEAARGLRIEHLLSRRPGQLSGGQRQRVALGRAIVRKPAAFLMDEPLSNLDAALRVHMRAELSELHRALGATFVYVTHDQAEALTMSDRMAVMMGGRILQLGAPRRVYDDPDTLSVAEFVGSPKINVLPGAVDGAGRVSALGVPMGLGLGAGAGSGPVLGHVRVAIRPEFMRLSADPAEPGFAGRLAHREDLGVDAWLHLVLEDGAHRLVVRAAPQEAASLQVGAPLRAVSVPGAALVFATDGARLRPASVPAVAA